MHLGFNCKYKMVAHVKKIWLTMFLCFLTLFRNRMMKMWGALFDASIQKDVELLRDYMRPLAIRKSKVHVDN